MGIVCRVVVKNKILIKMDLPDPVKKGQPISASNTNKAFNAIRTLASYSTAGEFVKSTPLVKNTNKNICICLSQDTIDRILFCSYIMPFETFVGFSEERQQIYPYPKRYYKIYAKNGFVHYTYSVSSDALTDNAEYEYKEASGDISGKAMIDYRSAQVANGGFLLHTFSSEDTIELKSLELVEFPDDDDDCKKCSKSEVRYLKFSTALGVSYQVNGETITNVSCARKTIKSVIAIKSEISADKTPLDFPVIRSKHDSEINLAIPISSIVLREQWERHKFIIDCKCVCYTETAISTVYKKQYWKGNFSNTITYNNSTTYYVVDRCAGEFAWKYLNFVPYEIVPAETQCSCNTRYICGFDLIKCSPTTFGYNWTWY